MKTKDFTYWFIEELSKEDIEFQVNYISKDDSMRIIVSRNDGVKMGFTFDVEGGLYGLIETHNSIMEFIREENR